MTIGRIPSVEGGIQPTIVDAKGDLIAGVAADSVNRLAVGSNDQVLVADSAASTGMAWKSYGAQVVAGKNAIINGGFDIWQRGTSFTVGATNVYTADRWQTNRDGTSATVVASQQTFTPGTAPVAGYEGQYFFRLNQTVAGSGGSFNVIQNRIEDVRTFAGQTATISFWAKADSSRNISVNLEQSFGSGGSTPNVYTQIGSSITLTTSWVRYTVTGIVPSVSGKTIGTSSFLGLYFALPVNTTQTIDFWGIQMEAGSVATPFSRAAGTLQGELAACQRYYIRNTTGANYGAVASGSASSTTASLQTFVFPTQMRVTPTAVEYANLELGDNVNAGALVSAISINTNVCNKTIGAVDVTSAGLTQYRFYNLRATNNTGGYLAFSAEL